MRFTLTGKKHDVEMIGEQVAIAASPHEIFAVHPNVFADMHDSAFCVSHVETGFRVGTGKTIQAAINDAQNKCLSLSPVQMQERISMARDLRRSVAIKLQ